MGHADLMLTLHAAFELRFINREMRLAADVAVPDRRAFRGLPLAVGPVEAMLEDRGDGAVAASADVVAAPAGGIEPLDAISLGEPQTG
jgi:hypothetical protein